MEQFIEDFQHLYHIKPVKHLAPLMGASESLLYKWGETGRQHRTNPAERIVALTRATGDFALLDYVCHGLDGTFVPNAPANGSAPVNLAEARNAVTLLACGFVGAMARAVMARGVSTAEARIMRRHWERFKSAGESFVRACEWGVFQPSPCGAVLAHGHP